MERPNGKPQTRQIRSKESNEEIVFFFRPFSFGKFDVMSDD